VSCHTAHFLGLRGLAPLETLLSILISLSLPLLGGGDLDLDLDLDLEGEMLLE
jgi:hypothetical protein